MLLRNQLAMPGSTQATTIRPYQIERIPPTSRAQPGWALYPTVDDERLWSEGYKRCGPVAEIWSELAAMAGSVPWHYWSPDGRQEIVPWIEFPRKDRSRSRSSLIEEAVLQALNGNALIGVLWEGGERRVRPAEIQVENSHGCRPVIDREHGVSAYEWDDSALLGPQRWDARDIIHIIGRQDPLNPYWGWSILQAMMLELDAWVAAGEEQVRRMVRGGPAGVVLTDSNITTEGERARLQENLNNSGIMASGGYLVLAGSQKVDSFSPPTTKDIGTVEIRERLLTLLVRLCGLYPAEYSLDASTYNNLDQSKRRKWAIVKTILERFSDAFTTKTIPVSKHGKLWIAPDFSGIVDVEETAALIAQFKDLIASQVPYNEAIRVTGLALEYQPWGDNTFIPDRMVTAAEVARSFHNEEI